MQTVTLHYPAFARRLAKFTFLSIGFIIFAWPVNIAVLLYNFLATDMFWLLAVVIFCVGWLAILIVSRTIIKPAAEQITIDAKQMSDIRLKRMAAPGDDASGQIETIDLWWINCRSGEDRRCRGSDRRQALDRRRR